MINKSLINKNSLKKIEGNIQFYKVIFLNPTFTSRGVDVLIIKIKGHNDKIALKLNSKNDFKPIIEKFNTKGKI
ncbi:MAG: hypothetical protein ACOVQ2_00350 [Flavobacterium sp.]